MARNILTSQDAKGNTIKVFVKDNDGKRQTIQAFAKKLNKGAKKGLRGSQSARSVALTFMSDLFLNKEVLSLQLKQESLEKPLPVLIFRVVSLYLKNC